MALKETPDRLICRAEKSSKRPNPAVQTLFFSLAERAVQFQRACRTVGLTTPQHSQVANRVCDQRRRVCLKSVIVHC